MMELLEDNFQKSCRLSDEEDEPFVRDLLSLTPSYVQAWSQRPHPFQRIPLTFRDSMQYYSDLFYGPLFDEATAQVQQALQPNLRTHLEVDEKQTSFTTTATLMYWPDSKGPLIRCQFALINLDDRDRLLPSDLLLFRLGDGAEWMGFFDKQYVFCLNTPEVLRLLHLANQGNVDPRKPHLLEMTRLTNFGPMRRAANVLHHAPNIRFMHTILSGRLMPPVDSDTASPRAPLIREEALRFSLNPSQVVALMGVMSHFKTPGVALVQGPPGTGKTHTVDAIISCVMRTGKRLLVTAQTHMAVHNALLSFTKAMDPEHTGGGVAVPLDLHPYDILLYGNRDRIRKEAEQFPALRAYSAHDRLDRLRDAWSNYRTARTFYSQVLGCLRAARDDIDLTPACFEAMNKTLGTPPCIPPLTTFRDALAQLSRECPPALVPHEASACLKLIEQLAGPLGDLVPDLCACLQRWRATFPPPPPPGSTRPALPPPTPVVIFLPGWWAAVRGRLHTTDWSRVEQLAIRWARPMPKCPFWGEDSLLEHCRVLFCTLSAAGRPQVRGLGCRVAIVDEAAQVSEALTMVLYTNSLKKLILVGDPKQLPSLTISAEAKACGFGRSLMERLAHPQGGCHPVLLLNTQYRMHPDIALFPNQVFYEGRLADAASVLQRPVPVWQAHLPPISFIDVSTPEAQNGPNDKSLHNPGQVEVVMKILEALLGTVPRGSQTPSVGIIAPYAAQVERFQTWVSILKEQYPGLSLRASTVDGFQGGEEDIIFLSTVRCNPGGNIGFTNDPHRLNVALTRARQTLVLVGSLSTLTAASALRHPNEENHWGRLLASLRARQAILPLSRFPELAHLGVGFGVGPRGNNRKPRMVVPQGGRSAPPQGGSAVPQTTEEDRRPPTSPQGPTPCLRDMGRAESRGPPKTPTPPSCCCFSPQAAHFISIPSIHSPGEAASVPLGPKPPQEPPVVSHHHHQHMSAAEYGSDRSSESFCTIL
ncbi:putative P-loop nucleoside triphosphate hydrolase superfamily protein [Paratrimastix pyriformis]|uniref:P-loop nucleoside triphosphate hydrolase superfamily protein n=1 Tax=Paratrimastix pyriformis TaxID=342808 RepID=A0ABQ8UPS1_9EUKA|nr:putative P-loop nucleoside triphosphate hydrolase superfamily protein [Paratrimastix pyriformis]